MPCRIPPLPGSWLQQGSRRMEPDGALLQLHPRAQHPRLRALCCLHGRGILSSPIRSCSRPALHSARSGSILDALSCRISHLADTDALQPTNRVLAQPRRANQPVYSLQSAPRTSSRTAATEDLVRAVYCRVPSHLLQKLRSQHQALYLVSAAFDLVFIVGEVDVFGHGAALEHGGRAFQLEVLDQRDAVALGEQ